MKTETYRCDNPACAKEGVSQNGSPPAGWWHLGATHLPDLSKVGKIKALQAQSVAFNQVDACSLECVVPALRTLA